MRRGALTCLLLLLACEPGGNLWPLHVRLSGGLVDAAARDRPRRCAPVETERVTVPTGTFPAADALLTDEGDWVHVKLPSGARWIHVDAPVLVDSTFVLELREGLACPDVEVVPFARDARAVVFADAGVFSVDFSTHRASLLDPRAATFENCSMSKGRTTMRCSLDLTFGSATIYPDGRVDR